MIIRESPHPLTDIISEDILAAAPDGFPLPGGGRTRQRWEAFAATAGRDLALAKMVESHADALAIVTELAPHLVPGDGVGAVWAADLPMGVDLPRQRLRQLDRHWSQTVLLGRRAHVIRPDDGRWV